MSNPTHPSFTFSRPFLLKSLTPILTGIALCLLGQPLAADAPPASAPPPDPSANDTYAPAPPTTVPHPWIAYDEADRDKILALINHGSTGAWQPDDTADPKAAANESERLTLGLFKSGYTHLGPNYPFEGCRAWDFTDLAILAWLNPQGHLPGKTLGGGTYLDAIRTGIHAMHFCRERHGANVGEGRNNAGWGFVLDAGIALWDDSIAFDLLSSKEVHDAGLSDKDMDELYHKLADGVFHQLVDHLRTMSKNFDSPAADAEPMNNWNLREFCGIGMAAMAMKDRLEAEPHESQRYKDYVDGLAMLQHYMVKDFQTDNIRPGVDNYYYEGPHYVIYWLDYFMPLAKALQKGKPDLDPMLTLDPKQVLMSFMRTEAMTVSPNGRDYKTGKPYWSLGPMADMWVSDKLLGDALLTAAACSDGADSVPFLDAAKRLQAGPNYPEFTPYFLWLGKPILDQLKDPPAQDMPQVQAADAGLAVARTGSTMDDLTVVLKNTVTPFYPGDDKKFPGQINQSDHNHADNGEVFAYRNGEPILVEPGYGGHGYPNPHRYTIFTNWNHHNVPMIDDGKGYTDDMKKTIGEKGSFVLMTRHATDVRRTEATQIDGQKGKALLLRTDLGPEERFVIVPDKNSILIIDRLKTAMPLKLAWWGYGSAAGQAPVNTGDMSNQFTGTATPPPPPPNDSSMTLDDKGAAIYTRNKDSKVRIQTLMAAPPTTEQVPGQYGGESWGSLSDDITGVWYTSSQPTLYAVTLVEIGDGTNWSLTPTVKTDSNGAIKAVGIKSGSNQDEWTLPN